MTDAEQSALKQRAIEAALATKRRLACLELKLRQAGQDVSAAATDLLNISNGLRGGSRPPALRSYPAADDLQTTIAAILEARKTLESQRRTLTDLGLGDIL